MSRQPDRDDCPTCRRRGVVRCARPIMTWGRFPVVHYEQQEVLCADCAGRTRDQPKSPQH
jgi:hypothetical protein